MSDAGEGEPIIPDALNHEIDETTAAIGSALARLERVSGFDRRRWLRQDDEARGLLDREPGVRAAYDEVLASLNHLSGLLARHGQLIRSWRERTRKEGPG